MNLKNLGIGTKLAAGFILVIVIFIGVSIFQLLELNHLSDLQDEGARRAEDTVEILRISKRVDGVYAVIADSIINRNLAKAKQDFASVKKAAQADIKKVHELVDHEQERTLAKEFETEFNIYLGLFENKMLPILEKEESITRRMSDALEIMKIELRVAAVYSVIADGMINRNLDKTRADWKEIKATFEKDIALVARLSDTNQEKQLAEQFAANYRMYLDSFETETMPLLFQDDTPQNRAKIKNQDRKIDQARVATLKALNQVNKSLEEESISVIKDEKYIRLLDGEIDVVRDNSIKYLTMIAESFQEEQKEADALFDETALTTRLWTIIICIIAAVMGLIIAFFISIDITRPITHLVAFAKIPGGH